MNETIPAPVAASESPRRKGGRIAWLDSARGAGIILVVLGHALGGLIDSPLGAHLSGFHYAFFAIYTFHMPLFFMLSGLLVQQRLARGTAPFIKGLIPTVVWPYFLWSVVQFTVIYALGSLVNRPVNVYWSTVSALPLRPISQFWFLYALFWAHLIAVIGLPRIGREGLLVLGAVLKIIVALVIMPVTFKLIANNFLWYAIGVYLTPRGLAELCVDRSIAVRAAVLPLISAVLIVAALFGAELYGSDIPLISASSVELANLAWRLPVLATGIFGAVAAVAVASLPIFAGPHGRGGSLAELGRLTMPIFLLHVLFIAGSRIVLSRFLHLDNPAVLLVILVAAGLIGPLVVERLLRPFRLHRWLGF